MGRGRVLISRPVEIFERDGNGFGPDPKESADIDYGESCAMDVIDRPDLMVISPCRFAFNHEILSATISRGYLDT